MSSVAIFKALTAKKGLGKMSGSRSWRNAKGFVMLFERTAGKLEGEQTILHLQ